MGEPVSVPVRAVWKIPPEAPLLLYTGTFEPYQGLDLLYAAAKLLKITHPEARIMIVGGEPHQVRVAEARCSRDRLPVIFVGRRPADEVPSFVAACDILVSPRIAGTNTPLKIYSYLRSGRPIIATDLRTHTQVLEPGTALLVPPAPTALATAMGRLIDRPVEGQQLAQEARALASRRYSRAVYMNRTKQAYLKLLGVEEMDGRLPGEDRDVQVVRSPPGS